MHALRLKAFVMHIFVRDILYLVLNCKIPIEYILTERLVELKYK